MYRDVAQIRMGDAGVRHGLLSPASGRPVWSPLAEMGETMLLRAVIEETESEIAVITLFKTSKLKKYFPEETP